jgi:hypothetical protein
VSEPLNAGIAELMRRPVRRGHYPGVPLDRFMSNVRVRMGGCWEWAGPRWSTGYGRFKVAGRNHQAHRLLFMLSRGEIPPGTELDHLCRTRLCVHPLHLEPVDHSENVRRGTSPAARQSRQNSCRSGHPFDGVSKRGRRTCSVCARAYARRYWSEHPEFRASQRERMRPYQRAYHHRRKVALHAAGKLPK